MENILYNFEDISERDIDMLLIQEIGNNIELLKFILMHSEEYRRGEIIINNPKVVEIKHSCVERGHGESDVVVIYEDHGKKHGLFIEDKINAMAMEQQAKRYFDRADIAKDRGDIVDYCIFIIAPKKYIEDKNPEAEVHKYPNRLCYEDIIDNVKLNQFHLQQMNVAIGKRKSNYVAVRDDDMTRGWAEYKNYRDKYYLDLNMYDFKPERGSSGTWMKFLTWIDGVVIYHKTNPSKSNYGSIELNFKINPKFIHLLEDCLKQYVGDFYSNGYELRPCGKSEISLAKKVPLLDLRKLDLNDEENGQINVLEQCLQEVRKLNNEIVKKLLKDEVTEKIHKLVKRRHELTRVKILKTK